MPRRTRSSASTPAAAKEGAGDKQSDTASALPTAAQLAKTKKAPTSTGLSAPKKRGRGRPPHSRMEEDEPEPLPPAKPSRSTKPAASKATKGRSKAKEPVPAPSPMPPGPPASPAPSKKSKMVELADGVWAAMEESDAREMAERAAQGVRRLSDIPEVQAESEGVEEFHLTDISGSTDDDDDGPAETAVTTASTSEIELLRARIAQLEGLQELNKMKPSKDKKQASKSQNNGAKKTPTSFASGLRPSYYGATSTHSTTNKTSKLTSRSESPLRIGGLDDEDIEDTCPITHTPAAQPGSIARNLPRNPKRANQEVSIVADSTSQPQQAQRAQRHASTASPQQRAPTATSSQLRVPATPSSQQRAPATPSSQQRAPATPSSQQRAPTTLFSQQHVPTRFSQQRAPTAPPSQQRARTAPPSQQRAPALQRHETFISIEPTAIKVVVEQPQDKKGKQKKSSQLNANGVRANDLPSFVEVDNKWKEVFLPTLYHTFFLSDETFNAFKSASSEFHDTIQELVNLVYPDDKYTVGMGDPIILMAYNRINGMRSNIASDAMSTIQEFLRKTYSGKPGEAYEWLLWARRLESGPLFFEEPSPFQSTVRRDDPDFIFPSGRLRSPFLLSIVQGALKGINGTMKDRGLVPTGLFSIAMGALERAVHCLKPDATVDSDVLTNFCQTKWGAAIAGYCNGFTGVTAEKWATILSLCQDIALPSEVPSVQEEVRIIQRVNIFNFPSPTK
ncbi:hypothetical protein EST38_g9098 [Candolleomyces aberdarensis]|uniref:Uncharacterized protein n=1 Tax=Candolleomyces aberdarensis TaxID=2316362 RepID=A0A4Q2DD44_9AGAR|nr:hypothetical protein EST38_g9098 [Candolleomyces aberdarensis]